LNLLRALVDADTDHEFVVYLNSSRDKTHLPHAAQLQTVAVPPGTSIIRNTLSLPIAVGKSSVDVLHTQFISPPYCPTHSVVTIHDLGFEMPGYYSIARSAFLRVATPWSVRQATAVVTDSHYSKDQIVRRYRVSENKVFVCHIAPDPLFQPLADRTKLDDVRRRYNTGACYVLCVSVLQPRKNVETLVQAFTTVKRATDIPCKLVIVGPHWWQATRIENAVRESGLEHEIVMTGQVPQEDLVALYNAATVFVFPSLYEGFGLPPLEAMACGTPVICSNATSLPEVVGNAALTFTPTDVRALVQALMLVLQDEHQRQRLTVLGLERASQFKWTAAASKLLEVYVYAGRPTRSKRGGGAL
jgi:glycosyltransferase involved in cell wall biosynthesis